MQQHFTLQYWHEGEALVGRLKELPGLVVRGGDLDELEARASDACRALAAHESQAAQLEVKERRISVETFATPSGD
jgi:hypothetical protein